MDFVQARIDVMNWITGFVEKTNPGLNGWPPCPFARRARLNNEFDLRQGKLNPYVDLQQAILEPYTVIAYIYDPLLISAENFNQQVTMLNRDFLISRDILALADHPDDHEEVNGVCMNQGTWAITFIQPLNKLNDFAQQIAPKGYYNNWPEEYLNDLFDFRKDPRQ